MQPFSGLSAERRDELARLSYSEIMRRRLNGLELQFIARVHGYKAGWVYNQLRERRRREQRGLFDFDVGGEP